MSNTDAPKAGDFVDVPQQAGSPYQRRALVLFVSDKGYEVQRFQRVNGVSVCAGEPRVVKRCRKCKED